MVRGSDSRAIKEGSKVDKRRVKNQETGASTELFLS